MIWQSHHERCWQDSCGSTSKQITGEILLQNHVTWPISARFLITEVPIMAPTSMATATDCGDLNMVYYRLSCDSLTVLTLLAVTVLLPTVTFVEWSGKFAMKGIYGRAVEHSSEWYPVRAMQWAGWNALLSGSSCTVLPVTGTAAIKWKEAWTWSALIKCQLYSPQRRKVCLPYKRKQHHHTFPLVEQWFSTTWNLACWETHFLGEDNYFGAPQMLCDVYHTSEAAIY